MAIEFVAATSASTDNGSGSAMLTVPHSSGTHTGDFVLMVIRTWGRALYDPGIGNPVANGVAGTLWTRVLDNTDRGNNHNLHVFRGIAEPGTYGPTVYFAGPGYHQATILTFRGVDPAAPIAATAKAVDTAPAAHATPAVTAPGGSLIVRACATDTLGAAGGFTWAAGAVERSDHRSSAGYAYLSTATSDASGPVAATFTTAAAGMMATVALKPLLARRLMLGSAAVPLMLGNTEVEIKGP